MSEGHIVGLVFLVLVTHTIAVLFGVLLSLKITQKECVRCKKDKPVFCLHCLNDIKKAEFLIDTVPTQTDEDVLTGIIETQLNARKYRSKQFDIENKELAQEILKHFMRIKKG